MAYLLHYVDDIILTATNHQLLCYIISSLSKDFSMTNLVELHHFLGIKVKHKSRSLFIFQEAYYI